MTLLVIRAGSEMALPLDFKTCDFCYQSTLKNYSQTVKMYSGYVNPASNGGFFIAYWVEMRVECFFRTKKLGPQKP